MTMSLRRPDLWPSFVNHFAKQATLQIDIGGNLVCVVVDEIRKVPGVFRGHFLQPARKRAEVKATNSRVRPAEGDPKRASSVERVVQIAEDEALVCAECQFRRLCHFNDAVRGSLGA